MSIHICVYYMVNGLVCVYVIKVKVTGVLQYIPVGGRDSIGEAAVERPCRQASVSLLP